MPTAHLNSRWGDKSGNNPDVNAMRAALAELQREDAEHPDCWLSDEQGWTLSVSQGGWVIFENVETVCEPRHLKLSRPDDALELWRLLAAGDFASLESRPWQKGYPPSNAGRG